MTSGRSIENETGLRDAWIGYLASENDRTWAKATVVHELGLDEGRARADVALLGPRLHGCELKATRDNLNRLPGQIEAYSRVFAHCTLVTCASHLDGARRILPRWWGLVTACHDEHGLRFRRWRASKPNPQVQAYYLAQLLWRDEVEEILRSRSAYRGLSGKPRETLWRRLVDELGDAVGMEELVRRKLVERGEWRSC